MQDSSGMGPSSQGPRAIYQGVGRFFPGAWGRSRARSSGGPGRRPAVALGDGICPSFPRSPCRTASASVPPTLHPPRHATPLNAPRSQRSSAARALSARPPRRSFIAQETRLSLPPRRAKLKQRGRGESEGHHSGKSPSPQNPNVHLWAARVAPARTSPRPSGTI